VTHREEGNWPANRAPEAEPQPAGAA
jgi:hypothetical protein